jgi:regulator of nucleoside diphosphate kinase
MNARERPPVVMGALEFARLHSLLTTGLKEYFPDGASALRRTLMRASVVPTSAVPDDVIAVGALIVYREDRAQRWQQATLVYPWDEEGDSRRLSVFSPAGASLVGLSIGGAASWRSPSGEIYCWSVGGVWWPDRGRNQVA